MAAVRHRVDVRARHQRLQTRVGTRTSAHEVTCGVDTGFEPGFLHEAGNVIERLSIRVGIGHTSRPAVRRPAESLHRIHRAVESRRIDAQFVLGNRRQREQQACAREQCWSENCLDVHCSSRSVATPSIQLWAVTQ